MKSELSVLYIILILVTVSAFNIPSISGQNTNFQKPHANETNLLSLPLPADEVDQEQNRQDIYWGVYGSNVKLAQSFKPSKNIITRVMIRLIWQGSPEGLELSIRKTLEGNDLTSLYLDTEDLTTDTTGFWYEFDFPDISITPDTTYFIVWAPRGCPNKDNTFYWGLKDNNAYQDGQAWKYLNETWDILDPEMLPKGNPDFSFRTYGFNNNPPNKPTQPSGPTIGNTSEELRYTSRFDDVDGDSLEIIFDWGDGTDSGWVALESNGVCSMYHSWSENGSYNIKTKARDNYMESDWSEPLTVVIGNVPPEKPQKPSGPSSGKILVSYTYTTSTNDENDDNIYFQWDWGDGTTSEWIGPYVTGEICEIEHTWSSKGDYSITVRAKDEHGKESDWSDPLGISMPRMHNYKASFSWSDHADNLAYSTILANLVYHLQQRILQSQINCDM